MRGPECPTHRGQPLERCGYCEHAIDQRDSAAPDDTSDELDAMERRYERWLDEIGGTRMTMLAAALYAVLFIVVFGWTLPELLR